MKIKTSEAGRNSLLAHSAYRCVRAKFSIVMLTVLMMSAVGFGSHAIAAATTVAEGDSGQTAFKFTVTRTGDLANAIAASYVVTGSGENPADADDFVGGLPSGIVKFSVNQAVKEVSLKIKADTDVEPNESFDITIAGITLSGTILNDDSAIVITTKTPTVTDGGAKQFKFTVTRFGDLLNAISFSYAVTGSGANPADENDFVGGFPSGTIEFAADEVAQEFILNINPDTDVESDETFLVALAGGSITNNSAVTGTIRNEDSAFAISTDTPTVAEGGAPFSFTVTRTGDLSGRAQVGYSVTGSGDNAADAADFGKRLPRGTLKFAANEAVQTIALNINGDTNEEANEGFTVTLDRARSARIITPQVSGIIRNEDVAVEVVPAKFAVHEGNGGQSAIKLTVTRTGNLSDAASIDYIASGSGKNAADADDFIGGLPSGVVKFAANEAVQEIILKIKADTDVEPNESFDVTVAGITLSGTILNDDSAIVITTKTPTVTDGGAKQFKFTVTRSGYFTGAISFSYAVTGSGANPADENDFVGGFSSGTIEFAADEVVQEFILNINPDTDVESDETFSVALAGDSITNSAVTGTIRNDDSAFAISTDTPTVAEGGAPFSFTVTRTGDLSGRAQVGYSVTGSGDNAADAADFGRRLPRGTLKFAANEAVQTIALNINGDANEEANEGFTVTLDRARSARIITPQVSGIIRNDDVAFEVVPAKFAVHEGNGGQSAIRLTVTRTGNLSDAASIDYIVSGSGKNAADADDFIGGLPSGAVKFAANEAVQEIILKIKADTDVEPNESFDVTIEGITFSGTILNDDSAIVITTKTPTVTDGGAKQFKFTVTRFGDLSNAISFSYAVTGSGANPADTNDFVGGFSSGTIEFAADEVAQEFILNINPDTDVESDETFSVAVEGASVSGVIRNDDSAFAISTDTPTVAEGGAPFSFTVTRTGDLSGRARVGYSVTGSGDNAADAADFGKRLPRGTLKFAANEAVQTIALNINGDANEEANEGFTVTLDRARSAHIITPQVSGIIRNDDVAFEVVPAKFAAHEGNGGQSAIRLTVTRTGNLSDAASIDYIVSGSGKNAADADDFIGGLPSGAVKFAANEAVQEIILKIKADTDVEPNESFDVTIEGITLSGTILNDDSAIVITTKTPTVTDGGAKQFKFTVTRSGDLSNAISFSYAVTGSGANPADENDFVGGFSSGTIEFAADEVAQEFILNINPDTDVESDETFSVAVEGASVSGTIRNDDSAFAISTDTPTVAEGAPFSFTVTRTGDLSGRAQVGYSVTGSGDNAADAADFGRRLPRGTLKFAANEAVQTIALNINGDTDVEVEEGFTVTLDRARSAHIITPQVSGIIRKDDVAFEVVPAKFAVHEGNGGQSAIRLTVTRTGNLSDAASIDYIVSGSGKNAADADDFIGGLPSGAVKFAANEAVQEIILKIKADTDVEPNESFEVTIAGATLSGTILNDDSAE